MDRLGQSRCLHPAAPLTLHRKGGTATATGPTIAIGPLKLHWPHHGFDRAADTFSGVQHTRTLRTGHLGALVSPGGPGP